MIGTVPFSGRKTEIHIIIRIVLQMRTRSHEETMFVTVILIGIPYVRLVHLIGMWCFIIFAMIHVYLSILSGNVDRDGTISSMFSGGRWLRKGVKFRDE